jgi:lysophospholipase L1-like esterase
MVRPTRRKQRRWVRRFGFSMIPAAALLCMVELTARAFPPPQEQPAPRAVLLSAHPTRIWGLTPGNFLEAGVQVSIGADGLRQAAVTHAPFRILTLGDSSIYGYGLPDSDTLHAAIRLALADLGVDADVFCGAIPGYSTEQSLQLLDDVGWSLDPDVLLIGNLWSDSNKDHFQDRAWMDALGKGSQYVERGMARSAGWRWLRRILTPDEAWYLPIGWIRDPTLIGHRRVPLDDYRANLARMVEQAQERGTQSVFLQPTNRIRLQDIGRSQAYEHSWDPWFSAQRQVAASLNVPIVDAREVLHQVGLAGDQAFLDDMHPTARSNTAYAIAIAQQVTERGWLGSAVPPALETEPAAHPDPRSTGGSPP